MAGCKGPFLTLSLALFLGGCSGTGTVEHPAATPEATETPPVATHAPTPSTRGQRVVYARMANDVNDWGSLWSVGADGRHRRRLAALGYLPWSIACSPSGDRVAYDGAATHALTPDLWTTPTRGGRSRPLIEAPGWQLPVDWSDGGTSIMYVDGRSGTTSLVLHSLRTDRSRTLRRMAGPNGVGAVAWSADRRRIVAALSRPGTTPTTTLEVLDVDTTSPLPRIPVPPDFAVADVALSSRDRLAYTAGPSSFGDRGGHQYPAYLHLVDLDRGHDRTVVVPDRPGVTHLDWSPDGSRLAFVASAVDRSGDVAGWGRVFLVRPDGTHLTMLRGRAFTQAGSVDWSPDGTHLLVLRDRHGWQTLWALPLDGGPRTRLAAGYLRSAAWCA